MNVGKKGLSKWKNWYFYIEVILKNCWIWEVEENCMEVVCLSLCLCWKWFVIWWK